MITVFDAIAAVLAVAGVAYMTYSLIRPERF